MSEKQSNSPNQKQTIQKEEFIVDPITESQIPELDPKTKMVIREKTEIIQEITRIKKQILEADNRIIKIEIELSENKNLENNSADNSQKIQNKQGNFLVELINLKIKQKNLKIELSVFELKLFEIEEYLKNVEFSEDGLSAKFWKLANEDYGHFSNKLRDKCNIKERIVQRQELLKVCRQLLANYPLEKLENDRSYLTLENNSDKEFCYNRTFRDTVQETFIEILMELHLHDEVENTINTRMKEFENYQNLIIDGNTYKNYAKIAIRSFVEMEKYDAATEINDRMIGIITKEYQENQYVFAQKSEIGELQSNPYEELLSEFNLLKAQTYREKYLSQKPSQRSPNDLKIAQESIQICVQFYRDLLKRSIDEYNEKWTNKQPENSTDSMLKEAFSEIRPELLAYSQLESSEDRYFNGGEPYLFAKFGNVLVDYGANNTLLELAKIAALSENNLEGNSDYIQVLDGSPTEIVFQFLKAQSLIKKNPLEAGKIYEKLGAKDISDKISELKSSKNENESNIKMETTNKFPNFDVDLLAQIGLINAEIYEFLGNNSKLNLQENKEITKIKISQPQKLTLIRSLYRLKTHFTKFNITNKLDQKDIKILQFINSLNELITELVRKNISNLQESENLESFLWQSEKILININLPI